jgi:hypothetical protein
MLEQRLAHVHAGAGEYEFQRAYPARVAVMRGTPQRCAPLCRDVT